MRQGWRHLATVALCVMTVSVLVAAGTAATSTASAGAASSAAYVWPEFHDNARVSGVSADPAISRADAAGLGVRWMAPVGSSLDSPAVAWNKGLEQTLAYQGGKSGFFDAVDVSTGQIVWSDYLGSAVTSSPLVANGSVWIAPVGTGKLYKLNSATGATECTAPVVNTILSTPVAATPPGGVATIYFGSLGASAKDGPVTAFRESDCTQLWQWSGYVISGQNSGVWSPLSYAVDAKGVGLLLFGSANPDSEVYALDAATGTLVWRYATYDPAAEDWDVGAGVTSTAPGVNGFADGMAYVEGKDGILFALDLTTGSVGWQFNFGGNAPTNPVATSTDALSTPALSGSTLVFGDATGLYAVNAVTGVKQWFVAGTGDINSSPAIVGPSGQRVVAYGDLSGIFHVVQLSDGAPLYSYQTGGFITSSPADAEGNLLIDSNDGFLYDFAAGGGNGSAPSTAIASPISGSTVTNPDGSLVISGTASAPHGVKSVDVQVQMSGASGPWFHQSTGTFATGISTPTATLATPGGSTTRWSLSLPIPAQGGSFQLLASAVDTDGIGDTSAYSGTASAAAIPFTVDSTQGAPEVQLTPTRVTPTGRVTLTGTGFEPGESVSFSAPVTTGGTVLLTTETAGSTGATPAASVPLPPGSAFGPDQITATGATSGLVGTGSVYVSNDDAQFGYGPTHTGAEADDSVIEHYQAVSESTKLAQQWSVAGTTGFDTTPAFSQGIAYVGDESGVLHAVRMTSGQPVFTTTIGADIGSSPAVDGGRVFVGDDAGVLTAVNAATGAIEWTAEFGGLVSTPVVSDGTVYVGSSSGRVLALDETNGTVLWSATLVGSVSSAPAVDPVSGGIVVSTSKGSVAMLDPATGHVRWSDSFGGSLTGVMVSAGRAFVASTNGLVHALTVASGVPIWSADMDSAVTAPPVLAYDRVTVGDTAGAVSYFDQTTGSLINTQAFFGHPITGITSTLGLIVLTSPWGLGMISGAEYVRMTWIFTEGTGYSAPAVLLNGDLFVAGNDGLLRGFTTPGRPMA